MSEQSFFTSMDELADIVELAKNFRGPVSKTRITYNGENFTAEIYQVGDEPLPRILISGNWG